MRNRSHRITQVLLAVLMIAALPATSVFAQGVGPVTSNVAVSPTPILLTTVVTVTATVDGTAEASNIASASFTVDGGTPVVMTAQDGAFDSLTEVVTGQFTPTALGPSQVCVTGTDAANNVGAPTCLDFTVESIYTFKGYKPPVRPENKARAGRTVPVKWKLVMTVGGAPVSDRTAIVGVETYLVDCTTLVGDATATTLEKAPGSKGKGNAGLRYLGRGNWIFNWKTPKEYGGTCRMMFIEFSDGSTSTPVLFRFR